MLWIALSCGSPKSPLRYADAPVFPVVSPSPGAELRASWVPLLVRVTPPFLDGEVQVFLDGRPLDLDLVQRERGSNLGVGVDVIGMLDLSDLEPGEHHLAIRLRSPQGRVVTQGQTFTWDRPPHRVDLTSDRPVRALFVRGGQPEALYTHEDVDPRDRDALLASVFVDGAATVWLDPGERTVICAAGLRHGLDVHDVDVDGPTTIACSPQPQVETPGRVTADFHVHTARSGDSFVPDPLREASLAAGDVDVVVISDHEVAWTGDRHVPGVEATIYQESPQSASGFRSVGHLNAFPVTELPEPKLPVHDLVAAYASAGAVVQLNHPRGIQFRPGSEPLPRAHAYLTHEGLEDLPPFDAVEVVNRFSWPLYLQVRQDWFALHNEGVRITGTGNSDSHALAVEHAGLPVNLVPQDDPIEAVRRGDVTVSTGPFVDLDVTGEVARVTVQAADWVPVTEARLVADGQVVWSAPVEELPASFEVDLPDASWVLAEAGWPLEREPEHLDPYNVLYPGAVPLGFTNPVALERAPAAPAD